MVEFFKETVTVSMSVRDVINTVKSNMKNDWQLLFENMANDQGEIVLLTGMFSGAGAIGLFAHGARKAMVFIKLVAANRGTQVTVITGGSESWLGTDFGRHRRNVEGIFKALGLQPG